MRLTYVLFGLILASLTGCSSLSSTYVGETAAGTKFEGMPIVVQRPKYLKVTYKKVTYRLLANRTEQNGATTIASVVSIGDEKVVDEITTEILSVGEVYALDLKRPLAGTTEYAVEFDTNSQYPKKVGAKIDDQTVVALSDAVKKIAETTFKAASSGADKTGEVVRVSETVVRIELRSLSDPNVRIDITPAR